MKLKPDALWALFFIAFIGAVVALIVAGRFLMEVGEHHFGIWGRIIAGLLALWVLFFVLMRWFYRFGDKLDDLSRAEARANYRGIYRVLSAPSCGDDRNNWQTSEITIGDFGWESTPMSKDGKIWLHGLTVDWGHVWRAGFQPDQVEYVGSKPVSQFDWKDFEYEGTKPTACYHWPLVKPKNPCPFPIRKIITDRRLHFPTTAV
jgi:hypothetical protein